jgi:hypothetical protein
MLRSLIDRLVSRKPADTVTWKAPRVLDQGPVGRPQIAMDEAGNAIAAWHHKGDKTEAIYTCRYRGPRSGWDMVPRRLDSALSGAVAPEIATNARGEIAVVWQEDEGPNTRILVRTVITQEETWAPYPVVIANLPGEVKGLQAAMDPLGNLHVAWCQINQGVSQVQATVSRPGGEGWEPLQPLGPAGHLPIYPQLAVNRNGHALVVWSEGNRIMASHHERTLGAWSDRPTEVANGVAMHLRMDLDDSGNAMVLWTTLAQGKQVLNASYLSGVTVDWRPPQQLASGEAVQWPQVGLDGRGGAFAAWRQGASGVMKLFARRFKDGAWEQALEPMSSDLGQSKFHSLSVSEKGAAVLWSQTHEGMTTIYARRFLNGAWVPAPMQLGAPAAREVQDPWVFMADSGDVAAVWRQGGASRGAIVTAVGEA